MAKVCPINADLEHNGRALRGGSATTTASWKRNRLTNLLATWGVVIAARAAMEAAVVSGTTDFMLRRQRMLELDAAVTISSLRAS